jgi:recombination protein RecT
MANVNEERARYHAQRVTETRKIFKDRYKLLSALFPTNGETLVARACAVACSVVNTDTLERAAVETVVEKVIACHHLGLEIGDQAYLVPFDGKTNLIIGPRGLIALAYRSGFVRSMHAGIVFRADVEAKLFSYNMGTGAISHEKATSGRRVGGRPEELITHAYCVVDTTTGGRYAEVLTAEDIAYYRGFSKAKKGPWYDNYEGMCRKTVIKRSTEYVPRSPLMAAALKENEVGGYEIPEEMWEQAKLRATGSVSEQVPADGAWEANNGATDAKLRPAPEVIDAQRAAIDRDADPERDGR